MTGDLFAAAPVAFSGLSPEWLAEALEVALTSRRKVLAKIEADAELHASVLEAIAVVVKQRAAAYLCATTDPTFDPVPEAFGWIGREAPEHRAAWRVLQQFLIASSDLPVPPDD